MYSKQRHYKNWPIVSLLIFGVVLTGAFPASAATFYLRAEQFTQTMADGVEITMWGFAQDSAFEAHDGIPAVPGPRLTVPANDTILEIRLENNLSVPISLVIPGQLAPLTPVRDSAGRATSLTQVTSPGNTMYVEYRWENLQAGTYLYQSGTHQAVQLQMGLFGALTKDSGMNEAYPGIPYDQDIVLLFSEIDPALHLAVADGTYGPAGPLMTMTSTIDYKPRYFLINGKSFPESKINGGHPVVAGKRILIRYLNASLTTHVPVFQGPYLELVAEDGNVMPWSRHVLAVHLTAGKTHDAVLGPLTPGRYPVYDRRLALTNAQTPGGGMLAYLTVIPGSNNILRPISGGGSSHQSLPGNKR